MTTAPEMFELFILGSGTGIPSLKRASPGYLVCVGSDRLLLDGGSGTLRRLLEAGIQHDEVDFLFYSHFHPDHSLDIISFLFASRIPEHPRRKKLTLTGPKGLRTFYQKAVALYGNSIEAQGYELEIHEVADDELRFNRWKVAARTVKHIEYSVGYRIEYDGRTIAYSGDTGYCQGIVELGRNVDLLLLECSFPNRPGIEGHLTAGRAGQIAREAQCKKLVLTHFYPPCEKEDVLQQAGEQYAGEIILAQDLMKLTVC